VTAKQHCCCQVAAAALRRLLASLAPVMAESERKNVSNEIVREELNTLMPTSKWQLLSDEFQ